MSKFSEETNMAKFLEFIEYPVLIYRDNRGCGFLANCLIKNIIAFGKTEIQAINNIEKNLKELTQDYCVKVKPIYKLQLEEL